MMITRITPNLEVYHGNINVGVITHGDQILLIDCGTGEVANSLAHPISELLFTHHHRDQAVGALGLADWGIRILVPEAERMWFEAPKRFGMTQSIVITCTIVHPSLSC